VVPAGGAPEVKRFGKYYLVRKLAEGGMAEIFLAKFIGPEGFERDVVLKRMRDALTHDTNFVNMFLDEARLAARLVHPNIIQIHELGLEAGCYFICMEHLPGEDFSAVVRTAHQKRQYVPYHLVARVIADAANGLHFAHEFTDSAGRNLGIVHRDISPANIYLTYQGQVKVLDFGIAKANSKVANTAAGTVKGKYVYMAPEQARGEGVDRRADVFSLGVSLYEALTFTRPFDRDNDLAILKAILEGDFPSPRKLRRDVPEELEHIVLKAMSPDPDERFQSAAEMGVALEELIIGRTTGGAGGGQVGAYLRALFGDDRVMERSRIPSLAELLGPGEEPNNLTPQIVTQPGGPTSTPSQVTESLPSAMYGKYRLVGEISIGGMAELFLGLQAGMEGFVKVVALKRILPHMAASSEVVEMFLEEARLAARLDHPNIVHIYDLGSSDGQYFISMEYLPGEDLSRIISFSRKDKKPASAELAAAVVQAAADGLHFAHQLTDEQGKLLGLVHRDVNPSNIIVTYHGQVKLVDFGIAKATVKAGGTQKGMIKGKPGYVAPEQANGSPADARSDVFCLGIVLWELLALRKLFMRETEAGTLMAILNDPAPLLRQIRPDVDLMLEQIVQRALAKDPAARYQSAAELHDALERWFKGRNASRPSTKDVATWLTGLFGAERSRAKTQIARGSNLATAIPVVMKAISPGSMPSGIIPLGTPATPMISEGSGPFDPVTEAALPPALRGRRLGILAGFAAVLALGVAAAVLGTRRGASAGQVIAEQARVSLSISSDPAGAFVFIGGEPTGRTTPVTMDDLAPGSTVMVRLEKAGYAPTRQDVVLGAAGVTSRHFDLQKVTGRVTFRGLRPADTLMVDGARASGEAMDLGVGTHSVQLMSNGNVVWSRSITVADGEQTVDLPQR
jgi:serine/threonine protein kinase